MFQCASVIRFINWRTTYGRLSLAVLVALTLALIMPIGATLAGPVAPVEVSFTQPDGTEIVVAPFGDEYYSGYEYEGYTILLDPATGYWVYAQADVSGQLIPGLGKVGIDKRPDELPPHLRDRQAMRARSALESMASPSAWSGSSGSGKVLIILIDFTPSTSLGTTDAQWNATFFDNTPGAKSVKNYYEQASYGKFTMEPAAETYGAVNDGVIAVTLPYINSYPWPDESERTSVRDALTAADPYVDFNALDTNHNGSLDNTELHLVLIVRGYEESYGGTAGACTPNVWGHRWSMPTGTCPYCAPTLDGVTIGASTYKGGYTREGEWHEFNIEGCTSAAGHKATIGIMVHELGHDIDWPDLYDTDTTDGSDSAGVGNWSIMAGGSWGWATGDLYSGQTPVLPDAFLKWYQGWLTPTQVTTPTTNVALPSSAQNPAAYLLGINPKGIDWDFGTTSGTGEYFLVENRQQQGFDTGLRSISANAKGCLIWHIDETRTSANTANANPARKLVDMEEANGSPQDLDLTTGGNNGDDGDPWPGSTNNTTFNDASVPNSNWYNGSTSGIAVTNISAAGTGCTLDFSSVGPTWNGSTSSDWDTADNWTTARVPNQNDNTVIPSGVSNWPDVNVAASVGNLNILDGAQVGATADVALDVYGNWAEEGTGYFDASAGTVTFAGSSAQSIVTGANSHFNDLQIGDGSTMQTVTAGSDLDVNGDLTIQPGARLAAGSHTIYLGGNWTDNPFGFDPGSGTVILDGATPTVQRAASEKVVYSNDLTSTTGWSIYDANGNGTTWYYSSNTTGPNIPNHGQHARYQQPNAADDWLFSPGFTLQAGVAYVIHFNYSSMGAPYSERLAVHIGTGQTVGTMTAQLFDNNNVTNTSWQPESGVFTPTSSGTYYVGFHCYSNANQYRLGVDDLVVTASDPNLAFYNLTVAGSGVATLADNAAVQNNLAINSGITLTMGTYDVTVEGTVTNNGRMAQTRTVNGGSATFLSIKNAIGDADKYRGVIVTSADDMGATTVVIGGNQDCTTKSSDPLIRRCFNIGPTMDQNATVRFYYTYDELHGQTFSTLIPWHWTLGWTAVGDTYSRSATCDAGQQDCWLEAQNITSYSPFGLGSGSAPTAVRLESLAANPIGSSNVTGLVVLLALLGIVSGLLVWKRRRSAA